MKCLLWFLIQCTNVFNNLFSLTFSHYVILKSSENTALKLPKELEIGNFSSQSSC